VIPYDTNLSPRISPDDLEMGSYEICLADLDDDGDGDTDTADLLYLLGTWGCGNPLHPAVPESIQDCMQRYGLDPEKLEACIEAMIRAGTP
jgi:hypothetical protein